MMKQCLNMKQDNLFKLKTLVYDKASFVGALLASNHVNKPF